MKKKKILLAQFPGREYLFRNSGPDLPLAAGRLKAAAFKAGLLKKLDVEIFDGSLPGGLLPAEDRLTRMIADTRPDVLGLSLYSFNAELSLHVARRVKRLRPHLLVVAGGPEVTPRTQHLLRDPAVDIGCFGNGEEVFVEILRLLAAGKNDWALLPGIFYRGADGRPVFTATRPARLRPPGTPSPYLLGLIDPGRYAAALLETYSGCRRKCAYCCQNRRSFGVFPRARVLKEIDLLIQSRCRVINIIDSDFLESPHFEAVCRRLIGRGNTKPLFATIRAEALTPARAELLARAGVRQVEIGVQTVHNTALRRIGRPVFDRAAFVRGIKLLQNRGIHAIADVIIGLPGEGLEDYRRTLEFLRAHKVETYAHLLQVHQGTRIRAEAARYGIRHMDRPPYFLTFSPALARGGLRKALSLHSYSPVPRQADWFEVLSPFFAAPFKRPLPLDAKRNSARLVGNGLVLDLTAAKNARRLEAAGRAAAGLAAVPFRVWAKVGAARRGLPRLLRLIKPIMEANPFMPVDLVLEFSGPAGVSARTVKAWTEKLPARQGFFCDSRKILPALRLALAFDVGTLARMGAMRRRDLSRAADLWSLVRRVPCPENLFPAQAPPDRIVFDFPAARAERRILNLLRRIHSRFGGRGRTIGFTDAVWRAVFDSLEQKTARLAVDVPKDRLLMLDGRLRAVACTGADAKTLLAAAARKMELTAGGSLR